MKVLIIEKDFRQSTIKDIFERYGFTTSLEYNPSEQYDFAWVHYGDNFPFVDKVRREQPQCLIIGYTSTICRNPMGETIGAVMEEKLKEHFDDLVYWDDSLHTILEKIIKQRKDEPAPK